MPRTLSTILALSIFSSLLCGCGSLELGLSGHLPGSRVELAKGRHLEFSKLGTQKLNGRRLRLPQADESTRFGVSFVDAGSLPASWRPKHATEGGILVAAIYRASPLAVAGMRPFDRVISIDGQAITDVQAAVDALSAIPLDLPVTLELIGLDGQEKQVVATAYTELNETTETELPLLSYEANQHESALSLGPYSGLFWYSSTLQTKESALKLGPFSGLALSSRTLQTKTWTYHERFRWGTLFNLIRWSSVRVKGSDQTKRQLRLLWFIPINF